MLNIHEAALLEQNIPSIGLRGRGSRSNMAGRHERFSTALFDDGWQGLEELPAFRTEVTPENAKAILSRNTSPDLPFDRSINPYQGCEHGCSYCYARPGHANWGLSPGLDFERRLFAKTNAAQLLREALSKPGYQPRTIALGAATDPYQPIEKQYRITRQILEVLAAFNHPVGIITKSALVIRDIDILKPMAQKGLVKVAISVTTLDNKLSRAMEPRAAAPHKRLQAIEQLAAAGIPTTVLVAPVIPALNDYEIEKILDATSVAGAREAGYVLLRLPREVADIFNQWLTSDYPERAERVMSLVRQTQGGKNYDSHWHTRQCGSGPVAWIIGRRFEKRAQLLGFNKRQLNLRTDLFKPPAQIGDQLSLL